MGKKIDLPYFVKVFTPYEETDMWTNVLMSNESDNACIPWGKLKLLMALNTPSLVIGDDGYFSLGGTGKLVRGDGKTDGARSRIISVENLFENVLCKEHIMY